MSTIKPRTALWLMALLSALITSSVAIAHESRPLYVEIKERAPNTYLATWKIPPTVKRDNLPSVAFPETCRSGGNRNPAAMIQSVLYRCRAELGGGELAIRYSAYNPSISTIIRFERLNGEAHSTVLGPDVMTWTVPERETETGVAAKFFVLGVKHILSGYDHLLFVLALIVIAGTWRRILVAVTGFTVAHSITLAGAALGWIRVPVPPIEAVIALSIVFLAVEIARDNRGTLTWRWPGAISFLFGLVHGFGFASVLSSIGLPQLEVPLALLFFNLGVEAGQLLFVAGVLLATFALGLLSDWKILRSSMARSGIAYGIGGIGMFWVIQRVVGF